MKKLLCSILLILLLMGMVIPCYASSTGIAGVGNVDTTFSNQSTNTTIAAAPCSFNLYATDGNGLNGFIFSTNNTGTWLNDTLTSLSGPTSWMNKTKTLNDTGGYIISYRWYVKDVDSNWMASLQYNITLTYAYIALQARDKDGANLPRTVSFSGSYSNGTTYSVTSNTNGYYLLPAIYGSVNVTTMWQSHIIKSATNITVTANAAQNLDTLISRLNTGSYYVLISVNETTTGTPELLTYSGWIIYNITGTSTPELCVDTANWARTAEPYSLKVGGIYVTWTWATPILTATVDFETNPTLDIELIYQSEGGVDGTPPVSTPPVTPTLVVYSKAIDLGSLYLDSSEQFTVTILWSGVNQVKITELVINSGVDILNYTFTLPEEFYKKAGEANGTATLDFTLSVPKNATLGRHSMLLTVKLTSGLVEALTSVPISFNVIEKSLVPVGGMAPMLIGVFLFVCLAVVMLMALKRKKNKALEHP